MKNGMNKLTLTLALALPLVVASVAAQAGSISSDQRYWPNETRSAVSSVLDAQASFAPVANAGARSCIYQGGPKTGSRTC